uniref:Uncharacterized protein n=1 Tax=Anopheles coluzzii TaxID=1518534 RepID=A0A8W7P7C8_ANOCL
MAGANVGEALKPFRGVIIVKIRCVNTTHVADTYCARPFPLPPAISPPDDSPLPPPPPPATAAAAAANPLASACCWFRLCGESGPEEHELSFAPSGMVGMAVWLTDVTVAEEVRVELDCAAAAAAATFDGSDGGSSGLHGECEPAEVLDEAANGTPDDE